METYRLIGVDFGTTVSSVYQMIMNSPSNQNSGDSDSYIAFHGNDCYFGTAAKKKMGNEGYQVVYELKRVIGLDEDDESIDEDKEKWPFKIVGNDRGKACIQLELPFNGETITRTVDPEVLVAQYLNHLLEERVENRLRCKAVFSIPAKFSNVQREAMKSAVNQLRLADVRFFPEPTAAAMAYIRESPSIVDNSCIVVYDFGGGTFDVSVLRYSHKDFTVLYTTGDAHLGGADIDNSLMDYVVKLLQRVEPGFCLSSYRAKSNAKRLFEEIKCMVSTQEPYTLYASDIDRKYEREGSEPVNITKAMLREVCAPFIQRTIAILREVFDRPHDGFRAEEIKYILPVGGCSNIPFVLEALNKAFPKVKVLRAPDPTHMVAKGACYLAQRVFSTAPDLSCHYDVLPQSIGIRSNYSSITVMRRGTPADTEVALDTMVPEYDDAESFTIVLYQGNCEPFSEKDCIGRILVPIAHPGPRDNCPIDVKLKYTSNGLLDVVVYVRGIEEKRGTFMDKWCNEREEEVKKQYSEFESFFEPGERQRNKIGEILDCQEELKKRLRKMGKEDEYERIIKRQYSAKGLDDMSMIQLDKVLEGLQRKVEECTV